MAAATAMYHSGRDTLRKVVREARPGDVVETVREPKQRVLHKAFLRWHDKKNWPLLRAALTKMGRTELIGYGPNCLVPAGFGEAPAPQQAEADRRSGPGRRGRPRKTASGRKRGAGGKSAPGGKGQPGNRGSRRK